MSIIDLLLKGTPKQIQNSTLTKGIGPRGAEKIVEARVGEDAVTDVATLINMGAREQQYRNPMLETLKEEQADRAQKFLADRAPSNPAQLLLGHDPRVGLDPREIHELNSASNYSKTFSQNTGMVIADGYDEAAHAASNVSTAAESMSGSTSGNTGRMFDLRDTTSSGFLNSIGGETGGGILAASMLGGLTGGFANMAFGGEFGEGAAMGALAGGGIAIGARAITANSDNIENFMRDRVRRAKEAGGEMGLMDRGMQAMINSENPTLGIQSRHLVAAGGALSGMAFTGRRKDKRRGFNAHRGNRI